MFRGLGVGACPVCKPNLLGSPTGRFMGSYKWVRSTVTLIINHIGGLITPLTTTHEPPSIESPASNDPLTSKGPMGLGPTWSSWTKSGWGPPRHQGPTYVCYDFAFEFVFCQRGLCLWLFVFVYKVFFFVRVFVRNYM